jgi:hypothetical protein
MGTFYRLYFQDTTWVIDTGRGSTQQTFSNVNVNGAVGSASSDFNFITFENAVLSITGTTATLTQGA